MHDGGFSVDASVRIAAADRAGRERLLRYGARLPFSLELLERLAALVPPPRVRRHRYYGVLAPNAPLRQAVTAMARGPPPSDMSAARDQLDPQAHLAPAYEFDQRIAW